MFGDNYSERKIIFKKIFHPIYVLKWLIYQLRKESDKNIYLITDRQSGTHWVKLMMAKSLVDYYQLDYQFQGILSKEVFSYRAKKSQSGSLSRFEDSNAPRLQQFHFSYFPLFKGKKVILLTRDLRDALVSQYEKYNKNVLSQLSFSEFLRKGPTDEDSGRYALETRIKFLNSWWRNRHKPQDLFLLKYEDIVQDTESELKKILDFIGLHDVGEQFIKNVIEFASIDSMRSLEKNSPSANVIRHVVNKGQAGRYKDYFSPEDMNYFRKEVNNKLIHHFGYNY